MKPSKDPVDGALDMLRNESWTVDPFTPEMENRLMTQHDHQQAHRARFNRSSVTAVSCFALLLLGGAAFAATDGISALKRFLQIEINGKVTDIELDENGESTFEVDTEDGGTATVHVQHKQDEDSYSTTVEVQKEGGMVRNEDGEWVPFEGEIEEEFAVAAMRKAGAPEMFTEMREGFSLEDAAKETPAAEWSNEDGTRRVTLHIVPVDGSDRVRVAAIGHNFHGLDEGLSLVGMSMMPDQPGFAPSVSVDGDNVTVIWDNGAGEVREMQFRSSRTATSNGRTPGIPLPPNMNFPGGNIRVSVNPGQNAGATTNKTVDSFTFGKRRPASSRPDNSELRKLTSSDAYRNMSIDEPDAEWKAEDGARVVAHVIDYGSDEQLGLRVLVKSAGVFLFSDFIPIHLRDHELTLDVDRAEGAMTANWSDADGTVVETRTYPWIAGEPSGRAKSGSPTYSTPIGGMRLLDSSAGQGGKDDSE